MAGQIEILHKSTLDKVHAIVTSIRALDLSHPTRVAIDGFCASGKSTISMAIADVMKAHHIPVITISTDDFQNPPEIRWRLGEHSPHGFYRDSIDTDTLLSDVLEPLGENGSRLYRRSSYDILKMRPNRSEECIATRNSVVLIDGLFLHIDKLIEHFDYTIYVEAAFETCVRRALRRNQEQISDSLLLRSIYQERYIRGYQIYLDEVDPLSKASSVVENQ